MLPSDLECCFSREFKALFKDEAYDLWDIDLFFPYVNNLKVNDPNLKIIKGIGAAVKRPTTYYSNHTILLNNLERGQLHTVTVAVQTEPEQFIYHPAGHVFCVPVFNYFALEALTKLWGEPSEEKFKLIERIASSYLMSRVYRMNSSYGAIEIEPVFISDSKMIGSTHPKQYYCFSVIFKTAYLVKT